MAHKYQTSASAPTPRAEDEAREKKYRAEDALRTLKRAEEIRSDRELMRDVKICAKADMKAVSRVIAPKKRS